MPQIDRRRRLPLQLLTLAAAACHSAPAPGTSEPPRASAAPRALTGVLVDSLLTNDVLRGALLEFDGSATLSGTNHQGEFRLDGVTPGRHRLLVRHPLLDSLGVDTISVSIVQPATDGAPVSIALPTPQAFLETRCPARRSTPGDGMLIGVVRASESDQPIGGVEVAAAWRAGDSSFAGTGVRERARVRTNASGQFLICRAPRFTPVELWARFGGRDTPRTRLQLAASVFGAYDLSVDSSASDTTRIITAQLQYGTLAGRILTRAGDGLPHATLQIDRPSRRIVSDSIGAFNFGSVAPGVRTLDIRAVGFRPSRIGVNVRPMQRVMRDVTLDRSVAVLGLVTVRARRRDSWDSLAFEGRRKRGSGYFFTREELKGVSDLSTALRMVPGIGGRSTDRSQRLTAGRGAGCFPGFIVNGVRFAAGGAIGPEAMVRASDIRAMEVYTSRLSTPPEYQMYVDCAVVVIWLRDPQAELESDRNADAASDAKATASRR